MEPQLMQDKSFLDPYLETIPREKRSSAAVAFLAGLDHLKDHSPLLVEYLLKELRLQRETLKLIASENYSSLATQLAMGNLLTDKYAEGYPFHRFYACCENIDAIEDQAATLARKLFDVPFAYVQPHSGADANLVAFWAILVTRVQTKELERLGKNRIDSLSNEDYEKMRKLFGQQKLMGLSLDSGGHLTHGFRHNVSAKMFEVIPYDVDPETLLLDYDQIRETALRERPLILLAGYSAYPRLIDFQKMREIADEAGSVLMVDMAHFAGLVAGGVLRGRYSPTAYADVITSTTHKTLRGPRGGLILCKEEFCDAVNRGCPLVLGGPLPHVIAAKAVAFKEALQPEFADYAQQVVDNADALAEALKAHGLKLWTDGTDNHLVVIDTSPLGITGRQAEHALTEVGISLNRNSIPFDPMGAWYTSGLRLGTPALTTRGLGKKEMVEIARLINDTLLEIKVQTSDSGKKSLAKYTLDETLAMRVRAEVAELLSQFPLYPEIPEFVD